MRGDLRRILAVQALRALAYGFGSVLLGACLAAGGLSDAEVGLVFAAMLAGAALASLLVGSRAERWGRRRTYVALLGVMGLAGAAFALSSWLPLLLLTALTGTLSTDPNESGPITSLEQAMLGEADPRERARVFGRYNAVAYLAGSAGALLAGGPQALRSLLPGLPAEQRFLLLIPAAAIAAVAVALRLSSHVEAAGHGQPARGGAGRGPLTTSRSVVVRLAALFSLDAFAGGFIVQSFLVFWFQRVFGASTELLALVFFASGLLQAASSIAAGWLAGRIGMLETMVLTHLPSNLLLVLVPFAPTLRAAIVMLLVRYSLSQMDVPARQAYVAALVEPHERTAAAAYTNTARYLARPLGPALAGAALGLAPAVPFLVAGSLKVIYDLAVWVVFRRVPLRDGAPRT